MGLIWSSENETELYEEFEKDVDAHIVEGSPE
jgi:hypothetical protein